MEGQCHVDTVIYLVENQYNTINNSIWPCTHTYSSNWISSVVVSMCDYGSEGWRFKPH